jgi:putative transposase
MIFASDTILSVLRVLKCRLYPNRAQADRLNAYIDQSRHCYNKALEQRIHAIKPNGKGIAYNDQQAQLTKQRAIAGPMQDVPCDAQRDGLRRVDSAFKNFFRRCKDGAKKKGFPRFKSSSRFNSITLTTVPNPSELIRGRLQITGISKSIRTRGLQLTAAQPKRMTVSRRAGKWHARLLVDDHKPEPAKREIIKAIGIDVGLNSFIATSDGAAVDCPKHYRRLQSRLRRAQKLMSRRVKGSNRRERSLLAVQRVHEKIENARDYFLHKLSKQLVADHELIATEKLNIRGMVRSNLAKSILDAGWGRFNWMLHYKAECAGVTFLQVNPSMTSQECSQCGRIVPKDRGERVHKCECGCVLDRDHNAARNVLKRAQIILNTGRGIAPENARGEPAPTAPAMASQAGSLSLVD